MIRSIAGGMAVGAIADSPGEMLWGLVIVTLGIAISHLVEDEA